MTKDEIICYGKIAEYCLNHGEFDIPDDVKFPFSFVLGEVYHLIPVSDVLSFYNSVFNEGRSFIFIDDTYKIFTPLTVDDMKDLGFSDYDAKISVLGRCSVCVCNDCVKRGSCFHCGCYTCSGNVDNSDFDVDDNDMQSCDKFVRFSDG